MIEIHSDDFCITPGASRQILNCINNGCVNGISIMPDSEYFAECLDILKAECGKDIFISVHLDLITGKAVSGKSVITDRDGFFNITYIKYILIFLIPLYRRKYREAVKKELSAQLDLCLPYLDRKKIRIDSHRHIHMVPGIFSVVMELIKEKGLGLEYMRITKDRPGYFKGLPAFQHFSIKGVIKSLLLRFFSDIDLCRFHRELKGHTADFAAILFSGMMTEKNLRLILENKRHSKNLAGRDLEIMVHPYFVSDPGEIQRIHDTEDKGYVASDMRRKEIDAVLSERIKTLT
ncbi:MAG: ChbG/HpnK family deacetylase [Lachnospiraceae bacterium]|nr:ChbG/HpnK family deacetylase [Lachnospiraceae bacterium]